MIKIFNEVSASLLENKVNSFLLSKQYSSIISIQYQTKERSYSVCIWYTK